MQKTTHKIDIQLHVCCSPSNMRASLSICINVVPAVCLQIDVQSGSIPVECLSREVDYSKGTSPCHSAGPDTPISLAFPAL